ncbi:hypothetical protein [Oceanobacillus sojae]|uniref:hypothetical protein n=1 Tax=Oceanobacillus sojae TaxID=582851 RepID=UPI00098852CC|nr:hypothetical protein [Oceanobacillus sojae]
MEIETFQTKQNRNQIKVFFVVEDGKVTSVKVGDQVVSLEQGFQFYVHYYVAYQIDKCELYIDGFTPKLCVRQGEEIVIPTEEQQRAKNIEALERELKELQGDSYE